jgi:mRNA interferase YafQ
MRAADYTGQFKKDYRLAARRGLDLEIIDEVIRLLAAGLPLPGHYRDHALSGNYQNRRECHLRPDWLLIYQLSPGLVIFERTGTHTDLFG